MMGSLRAFLAAMRDESRQMFRIKAVVVMLLAIPVVYPLTVSYLYSNNSAVERPAVIIDFDNSAMSRTLTTWIDATRDVAVVSRIDSVEDGWKMIRRNQAEMLILIPADFSTRVKQGRQAEYKIWVNTANIYTMGTSLPGVFTASGTLSAAIGAKYLMAAKGVAPSAVLAKVQPIATDMRPEFLPSSGYGDFLTCGILMMVVHQLMLLCLGFSIGFQKNAGTFKWTDRWPYSRALGRLAAQSPFYFGAAAVIVYGVIPLFGWPVVDKNVLMLLYAALIVTMTPFTIFIVSLLKDHVAAFETLMFLSAPVFLMSGFTWPADQMPAVLGHIASVMPITPALQAQRILMLKSSAIADIAPYLRWMGIQFAVWTAACLVWLNRPAVLHRHAIAKRIASILRRAPGQRKEVSE